jgi:ABC-type glucose/galactose transport system permease subunit
VGTDETYMPPSRSPWAETWHLLRKNRMALSGLVIFLVFFAVAVAGLVVTSGKDPLSGSRPCALAGKAASTVVLP